MNKQESKLEKNLYLLLSWIPIFNSASWLIMDSHVPNKKWRIFGWGSLAMRLIIAVFFTLPTVAARLILLNILLYFISFFGLLIARKNYMNELAKSEKADKDACLRGKPFSWKLKKSLYLIPSLLYGCSFISFFIKNKKVKNKGSFIAGWISLAACILSIIMVFSTGGSIHTQLDGIFLYSGFCIGLISFFCPLFYLIWKNHDYLTVLASQENRNEFIRMLDKPAQSTENDSSPRPNDHAVSVRTDDHSHDGKGSPVLPQPSAASTTPAPAKEAEKIDINSADEKKLASLPGLTIIDAKKAIEYRDNNGGFDNEDAFFALLGLKPHIIVKLKDLIIVGQKKEKAATPSQPRRRRFDI